MHELKTDEFADLYADELKADGGVISGEQFVDECQVESDLELLLPADYVTGSSERMLLYRELDGLTLDKDVDAFRTCSKTASVRFLPKRKNCCASFPCDAWLPASAWRKSF